MEAMEARRRRKGDHEAAGRGLMFAAQALLWPPLALSFSLRARLIQAEVQATVVTHVAPNHFWLASTSAILLPACLSSGRVNCPDASPVTDVFTPPILLLPSKPSG